MKQRRCPLCEKDWESTICPVHGVPTIGPSQGRAQRLDVGAVLVGRFRITGLLTQGGMGALLFATDLRSGRRVVVKVLRDERVLEPTNVRRFYQEARAVRALSHPNIVEILMFGVDEATGAPFLAMEHVAGRTLKVSLAEDGPMTEARAGVIFLQIARALEAAHRAHVLHRDLKPSNVMVHDDPLGPLVKVLDFGLAKPLEDPGTSPLTRPGKIVGTPAFMAPEQVAQRPQDARTDVYGLGCMLHATLTGSPPFTGRDLVEVMHKQMRNLAPPLPAQLVDGRAPSAELRRLHHRLLAKSPDDRPPDMTSVVRALTALVPETEPRSAAGSTSTAFADTSTAFADTQIDVAAVAPASTVVDHPVVHVAGIADAPTANTPLPARPPLSNDAAMAGFGGPDDHDAVTAVLPTSNVGPPAGVPAAITEPEEPLPARPANEARPEPVRTDAPRLLASPSADGARPLGADAASIPPSRLRTPHPISPSTLPNRSRWWAVGGGVAALALALVVGTTFAPRRIDVRAGQARAGRPPDGIPIRPPPSPSTPTIELLTYPVRADVTIEGRKAGLAPVIVERPSPGQALTVLIWRAGYQTAQLTLQHDTPSPVEIELAR